MIRIYINEALKNIRINFIINAAIVIIVSVMTFMGIICVQVKISDQKTEVSLGQEAFIEFSQYHFITPGRRTLRLLERLDDNYERTVPEEEAFI